MGHFCIGAYIKVLLSCAVKGETQASFCPKLFGLLDKTVAYSLSEDSIGQILSGSQNLNPEWITAARGIKAAYAERYFYQIIRPCIEDQKKELLVIGLKEIIKNDSMKMDIELGTISKMTKQEFLEMNVLPLTQVLTDLFLYAVIHTDNRDQNKFLKGIKKNYCDQFASRRDEVKTYEAEAVRPLKSISNSLRGKRFDSTFEKVYESPIGLRKPNHVQIYRVELGEIEFEYEQLEAFVENSIGYYLLSRTRIEELKEDEEEARIFPEGVRILKEQYKVRHKEVDDALGEILLYAFLEKALCAPKIMCSMEIQQPRYESDSIHLLKLPGDSMLPSYQVIFGTSDLIGDIRRSVNDALEKVEKIKSNKSKERRMLNPTILKQVFSEEEAKVVKNIILPNDLAVDHPAEAYGIFLAYTVMLPDGSQMNDDEYKAAVKKQLETDVTENIDYIYDEILRRGLDKNSFYIYLLPFNNIATDKKQIMAKVLGLGGVTS